MRLAPELNDGGLNTEDLMSPILPKDIGWEVVDSHTDEGLSRLRRWQRESPDKFSLTQYKSAVEELLEHAEGLGKNPKDAGGMVEVVVGKIYKATRRIEKKDIESLVRANPISEDLAWLSGEIQRVGGNFEVIDKGARWFRNKQTGKVFKYMGREASGVLRMARLVGLIPFEVIRQLKIEHIVCAGSSAAARTIDLLVALGAENISVWDSGIVSPAKSGLYPGFMGSIEAVGMYKTAALKVQVAGRNPDGMFEFHIGIVKPDGAELGTDDVSYSGFVKRATLILEVVDDPWTKTGLRNWLAVNCPNLPVVFLADLGNESIAGIEIPGREEHFHQELSSVELTRMGELPAEISRLDKPAVMKEALQAVWRMVKKELPPAHALQFVFFLLGMSSAWSQTPIAGVESSVIATKLILSHLMRRNVSERNYNSGGVPSTLVPEFTKEQEVTLGRIIEQMFAWQ